MSTPLTLRTDAEHLASPLPPLLAEAEQLAATVVVGDHGRRRAGLGDTFWQYRQAQPHDEARAIDWRRSAKSDTTFVQEKEWQIAQSVTIWVDASASMSFNSHTESKSHRARTLGLATAILLNRGGERIGMPGLPARRGTAQISNMADRLSIDDTADYGDPDAREMAPHSRALFISDFLGDLSKTQAALTAAADRGVRGAILQVLDPHEESFPFDGRTIFQSMSGTLEHETLKAGDLRDRYLTRLATRKDALTSLARTTGWQFDTHLTDHSAAQALMWIYHALARR